jgi:hypothetical protein
MMNNLERIARVPSIAIPTLPAAADTTTVVCLLVEVQVPGPC